MTMLVLGSHMGPLLQTEVKRAFAHRFTGEHKPAWARKPMPNGRPYPVQFADDADWLANTFFSVTKAGNLSKRAKHCVSYPTWPNNPELRKGTES